MVATRQRNRHLESLAPPCGTSQPTLFLFLEEARALALTRLVWPDRPRRSELGGLRLGIAVVRASNFHSFALSSTSLFDRTTATETPCSSSKECIRRCAVERRPVFVFTSIPKYRPLCKNCRSGQPGWRPMRFKRAPRTLPLRPPPASPAGKNVQRTSPLSTVLSSSTICI